MAEFRFICKALDCPMGQMREVGHGGSWETVSLLQQIGRTGITCVWQTHRECTGDLAIHTTDLLYAMVTKDLFQWPSVCCSHLLGSVDVLPYILVTWSGFTLCLSHTQAYAQVICFLLHTDLWLCPGLFLDWNQRDSLLVCVRRREKQMEPSIALFLAAPIVPWRGRCDLCRSFRNVLAHTSWAESHTSRGWQGSPLGISYWLSAVVRKACHGFTTTTTNRFHEAVTFSPMHLFRVIHHTFQITFTFSSGYRLQSWSIGWSTLYPLL